MSEHRIADNMEVSLHFRLRLEDGTEVDSTFDKTPATFQVGDGNLPPRRFPRRPGSADRSQLAASAPKLVRHPRVDRHVVRIAEPTFVLVGLERWPYIGC